MGSANIIEAQRTSADRVTTAHGELLVASAPKWEKGTLAIRPEDIEVRQQGGPNHVPGTISDRLFRGDHWELIVNLPGGIIRVSTEPDQVHRVGETVFLELPPDDLLVLRD